MNEDLEWHLSGNPEKVFIPGGLKRGANRRRAGEDVRAGDIVLQPPLRLRPQELAAIASTGRDRMQCFSPLRVAIFSTGDEVIAPGSEMQHGAVYDANASMLTGLVGQPGACITNLGVLPDKAEAVQSALLAASRDHDLLLTSGGVSAGEEDHVVNVLRDIGHLHMWRIAIKPGRPLSFGQIGDCVMLGLPGNPVAVFICYLLFAWPVLTRLSGNHWPEPRRYQLPAGFEMRKKKTGRREFLRGILTDTDDGKLHVKKYQHDGSGLISSLRAADGLIELDEHLTSVDPGDLVHFIPFSEFGIRRY